jgi:replicative DNA helicase
LNLEDKNIKALLENEVCNALLTDPNYFGTCIHHLDESYFSDTGSKIIFKTIKNHYTDFGNIPSLKEVILHNKTATKEEKEALKQTIKDINQNKEQVDTELLIQQTERFIKDAVFTKALILGADAMGEHNNQKKIEAFNLAEESVKITLNTDFGVFLDDIDTVYSEFKDKPGIKLSIPSFDAMIGSGYTPKTLHAVMAASGVGKSAAMTAFAVEFLKQNLDVVFITLEMSEAEVSKRIYSNLYNIKIQNLANTEKQVIKNKYNDLKDHIGNLVIKEFPAGGLSALGLEGFLNNLKNEKGIKNPVVMVDYLGLMSSDRVKSMDNSYAYYGSIAEELRAVAQKKNLVIFSPLQTNRSSINNLEADQSTLSESMKILMTLDSAFIIAQTPEMKETGKMKINFVKNRMSGKTWSFEIGFDYEHFRFKDSFIQNGVNPTAVKNPLTNSFENNLAKMIDC